MYHFSTVSGTVSIEKILLIIEVRIPLEKKLMRASSFFISLRAALFLNWEMCSGKGIIDFCGGKPGNGLVFNIFLNE